MAPLNVWPNTALSCNHQPDCMPHPLCSAGPVHNVREMLTDRMIHVQRSKSPVGNKNYHYIIYWLSSRGIEPGVTGIKITTIIKTTYIRILYTHENINPAPVVHGIDAYLSMLRLVIAVHDTSLRMAPPHRCPRCGCPPMETPDTDGLPSRPPIWMDPHRYPRCGCPPIKTPDTDGLPSRPPIWMDPHRCPRCGCPPIKTPDTDGLPSRPPIRMDSHRDPRYGWTPIDAPNTDALPSRPPIWMDPHRCPRYGWPPSIPPIDAPIRNGPPLMPPMQSSQTPRVKLYM